MRSCVCLWTQQAARRGACSGNVRKDPRCRHTASRRVRAEGPGPSHAVQASLMGHSTTPCPKGPCSSLCYVKDVVRGLLLVAERGGPGEIFFLSDGKDHGWKEIGRDAFARAAGRRAVRDVTVPESFIRTYAAIADMVAAVRRRPALLNRDKVKEMVQPGWVCDNGKSRSVLGFEPRVTLDEDRLTFAWYKEAKWL